MTNILSCSINSTNSKFMVRLKNNWLLLFARRLVNWRMTASLQPQLASMGRSVGRSEREYKLPAFHMGVAPPGTGLGGGWSRPPPRPKFSATSEEVVFIQWGITPPTTPRQIEHWALGQVTCPLKLPVTHMHQFGNYHFQISRARGGRLVVNTTLFPVPVTYPQSL